MIKMSSTQIGAINHGINVPKISLSRHGFHCGPCLLPMRFDPLSVSSLSLRAEHSSRKSLHVCFAGGQGMMENNGRKSLQEAMGQLKGQSLEDMLREQMQKGGSGGSPPGGRGGSGGGGGGSSSGSDGMSDETLQIVLATVSFIFMYIFVIDGLELIKLARDCIKFVSGKGQSVRLKRATYKWVRLYKSIIEKKEAIMNGLEKASTYWVHPDFFRGLLRRHYIKSNPQE